MRDICFNTAGTQFLSAAYDRYLKLWDTETGECLLLSELALLCISVVPGEMTRHADTGSHWKAADGTSVFVAWGSSVQAVLSLGSTVLTWVVPLQTLEDRHKLFWAPSD